MRWYRLNDVNKGLVVYGMALDCSWSTLFAPKVKKLSLELCKVEETDENGELSHCSL